MSPNTPNDHPDGNDPALDLAFRRRRAQRLSMRREPVDAASGTAVVAARLAKARAEALATPLPDVIDLT